MVRFEEGSEKKHEAWDFRARDDVMCRGPEKGVDGDGIELCLGFRGLFFTFYSSIQINQLCIALN